MAYTAIDKSSLHFNTKLYAGNNTADTNITGINFRPDLVWLKNRDNGTGSHALFDAVRGVSKRIKSDDAVAEATASGVSAFDSDGFTLGTSWNQASTNFVSWNWKANLAGSANTDGSINTTATSANTTAGISICKWTGSGANATIGHGLGVAPKMIMVKNLATTDSWNVYHESLGNGKRLFLDTTGAQSSTSDAWNSTSPTTSVFSVGTNTGTNKSGDALIAYCFAEKTGFSKFGEYAGNGDSTNPPFIYTGFKPNFVMVKKYNSTEAWVITDLVRDNAVGGGNGTGARLQAQSNAAEDSNNTWGAIHKFSNGFQPRHNDGVTNGSGDNYIYMAFAKAPLVGSNNIQATAR